MFRSLSILALVAGSSTIVGCAIQNPGTPPPTDRFYFPTGIAYAPDAESDGGGFLYVVSSNFDLRFNRGTIASIAIDSLGLPDTPPSAPTFIENPQIAGTVEIDSFGGPLELTQLPSQSGNQHRLFVTGRYSDVLQAVDVDGTALSCAVPSTTSDPRDCRSSATSLNLDPNNQLRDPYRTFVASDGFLYIGHVSVIDVPQGSNQNLHSYLGQIDAQNLGALGLLAAGIEPIDGIVQVGDFLYLGGRYSASYSAAPLRRVQLSNLNTTLEPVDLSSANIIDTRSIGVSSDGLRLFILTRSPDGVLVLDVSPGSNGIPRELPITLAETSAGATELAVIPRGPGRRDLVAVSCQTQGSVDIYDDEVGRVVASIQGVGSQPDAIALQPTRPGGGVRLFVSAFGQGDIGVIDIPDLDNPQTASVIAQVGPDENCLNDEVSLRPPECTPQEETP